MTHALALAHPSFTPSTPWLDESPKEHLSTFDLAAAGAGLVVLGLCRTGVFPQAGFVGAAIRRIGVATVLVLVVLPCLFFGLT